MVDRRVGGQFSSRMEANGVTARETFDAMSTHSGVQLRDGWQAILVDFARHVES